MFTSLGYHTFTIFMRLTMRVRNSLLRDFKEYEKATGRIRVRPMRDRNGRIISNFHIIEYNEKKGITWLITYNPLLGDQPYSIKAKINPKILAGTKDYIAAATADYLEKVENLFDIEANKISRILESFSSYSLNRVDYCINFDVKELGLDCSSQQMIKLIKQSDIPRHFVERTEYDTISHRKKTDKFSFYLKSDSVVINCYWKHWQLLNEFPDCKDLDKSLNVIRFEIQCKYPKVYSMSKIIKDRGDFFKVKNEMLSNDCYDRIVSYYFNKIIGRGNYYPLDNARRMIENQGFKLNKEYRLISALKLIKDRQGIANVKAALKGKDEEDFRRSLRELADLRINPVTIPKEWNIKFIPNLLEAYYNKISVEQAKERQEQVDLELLKDYFWEQKKHKKYKK